MKFNNKLYWSTRKLGGVSKSLNKACADCLPPLPNWPSKLLSVSCKVLHPSPPTPPTQIPRGSMPFSCQFFNIWEASVLKNKEPALAILPIAPVPKVAKNPASADFFCSLGFCDCASSAIFFAGVTISPEIRVVFGLYPSPSWRCNFAASVC